MKTKKEKTMKIEEQICWDCKKKITGIKIDEENKKVTGAKFYDTGKEIFVKCLSCYSADPVLRNFQESLVFSRVVGYLAPVNQYNRGKVAEYSQRKVFRTSALSNDPHKNKNKTVV